MRYRPFGRAGMAVSAVSLALDGEDLKSAGAWRDLVHAAFEEGINAFELRRPSPELAEGLAEGASAVPRRLLFVGLRVEESEEAGPLVRGIEEFIDRSGLGYFDLLSVEATPAPPRGVPAALRALKDQGRAVWLGVAGDHDLLEPHVEAGGFDALITPFNILSGWRERHMVRAAAERQLAVIGCDPYPARAAELAKAAADEAKPGWLAKPTLAGAGTYAFMCDTPGWSAEQICLAYALTEPAVASVQTVSVDREHLASLAEVPERDLPAGASAQVEMARFSAERAAGTERRRVMRA